MNGIVYEIGNIVQTNARGFGQWAFLIPCVFFVLFAGIYLIFSCLKLIRKSKPSEEPSVQAVQFIITIFSILGLTLYLIADNYYIIEQIKHNEFLVTLNDTKLRDEINNIINVVQPSLLLVSITLYRIIPEVIIFFFNKYNGDSDNNDRYTNDSYWIGMINVLVLIPELDSWFTIVQRIHENECSIQVKVVWAMWVLMVVAYTALLITSSSCGLYKDNDCNACDGLCCCFMTPSLILAFSLYLLGDNRLPLECLDFQDDYRVLSILKLFFLILVFIINLINVIVYACGLAFIIRRIVSERSHMRFCLIGMTWWYPDIILYVTKCLFT